MRHKTWSSIPIAVSLCPIWLSEHVDSSAHSCCAWLVNICTSFCTFYTVWVHSLKIDGRLCVLLCRLLGTTTSPNYLKVSHSVPPTLNGQNSKIKYAIDRHAINCFIDHFVVGHIVNKTDAIQHTTAKWIVIFQSTWLPLMRSLCTTANN